ncbi:MAG: hypothetical protein GC181_10810 [Bacteroidetes bacterium]|nr:hypothetical protein [Bacteroidota bacterium]
MLQAYPTKNGTGLSIFGDYGDLASLYDTVHEIAKTLDENNVRTKGQNQLLMNFAYEIRKAYSGDRLTDKVKFDGSAHELHYFGFHCIWTDILIFISALRYNAGYTQTDKLQQANMYMLEYVVERALFNYDGEGAADIKNFIAQGIHISDQYVFIIYQALHIRFVTDKPGKKRFRNIPTLLSDYFSIWRQEYNDLIRSFEASAKQQNCEITDLEFADFPDIVW